MGPRKCPPASAAPLAVVHPLAAAIGVHCDNHVACVGPGRVRTSGAYTADLHALADHLRTRGVTAVVLESTGVYRVPLFESLEAQGLEVALIEPSRARHRGARPEADGLGCQWPQRLHTFGSLRPPFRPPASAPALPGYWRRQMLVRPAAGHVQHMQKALEPMNVEPTEVASDGTGLTGMSTIAAILAGRRAPEASAASRHEKCAESEVELAEAPEGTWRPEHLFALKRAYALYRFHQRPIAECDQRIEAEPARSPRAAAAATPAPEPRKRGRKRNDVRSEATGPLFRALGVDLTAVDGIGVGTALVILAEIGADAAKSPTEKHLASWLGPCPRLERSNHTTENRAAREGRDRAAQALRMAARAVSRTETPPAAFYHRIQARLGGRGAIAATAREPAALVYRMPKYGLEYVRQSRDECEAKVRPQMERGLRRRAAAPGYELVPEAAAAGAEAGPAGVRVPAGGVGPPTTPSETPGPGSAGGRGESVPARIQGPEIRSSPDVTTRRVHREAL